MIFVENTIGIVGWNVAAGMDGLQVFNRINSVWAVGKKLEAGVFNLTSSADWLKEYTVWKIAKEIDSKAVLLINQTLWLELIFSNHINWLN